MTLPPVRSSTYAEAEKTSVAGYEGAGSPLPSASDPPITAENMNTILHGMFFRGACVVVLITGEFTRGFSDFLTTPWWIGLGLTVTGGVALLLSCRRQRNPDSPPTPPTAD